MVPNNSNEYLPNTVVTPSSLVITGITNGNPMIVTVIVNTVIQRNLYRQGQLVKLTVPITYKMWQADGLVARIQQVLGNDIYLEVDSTNFDVFSTPLNNDFNPASLAPFGCQNLTLDNTTRFVPFQSYNNIGN